MNKLFVAAAMIFTASIAQAGEYTIDLHCERAAEGNAFSQKTVKEFGWKCDGNDNPKIVETVKQEHTIPVTDFNIRSQNAKIAKLEARIVKLEKMVKDLTSNPVTTKPVEISNLPKELVAGGTKQDKITMCSTMKGLAEVIMTKRQDGVGMDTLLNAMTGSVADVVTQQLVIGAFEYPQMNGQEWKTRYINEFSNNTMLECMKNF